jgi:rhamnogalacturonyl hydrolase YesR
LTVAFFILHYSVILPLLQVKLLLTYTNTVAYQAVQKNNVSLMAETVRQIGLYRDVLKGGNLNWQHIIGPQSQDTGLWSTGNGWAAFGMCRVLHTLQKWPASSGSLGSQAGQLKSWIKEILDGAMGSGTDNGMLRNYLNDGSWFGEISGTALLTAIAYRMAVNDPGKSDL